MKLIEIVQRNSINCLYNYLEEIPTYFSSQGVTKELIERAINIKLFLIDDAKCYVVMTDKYFSGWGHARNKTNKFIVACDSLADARTIKNNASKRSEMKYINIHWSKPTIKSNQLASWQHFDELGEIWKR